ncbi:general stress protein [Vibrio superstes]|uniref:Membrane protein n=1 Tax=Vibrio superstes NBRC 103154 TaxID=1219062 RepID=A0A511QR28_9VIBR|nr:general stress protein [Vibrio superstes]GEM79799.1 membrane protein [Vibrio superstes NBRC 103154]
MKKNKIVSVVNTHAEAEEVMTTLVNSGFDVNHLSIVGKGFETQEHATGFYNMNDRVKTWGKAGALWGGVWGALLGSGMFWVPTFGALLVAGPLVTTLVGAIEGATITGGFSALGGALASIGIPKDSVIKYETAIKTDKFLIVLDLDEAEVAVAKDILSQHLVDVHQTEAAV